MKAGTRIVVGWAGVYLACFWWLAELARQAGDYVSLA